MRIYKFSLWTVLLFSGLSSVGQKPGASNFTRLDFETAVKSLEKISFLPLYSMTPREYELQDSATIIFSVRPAQYSKGLDMDGEVETIKISAKEVFVSVVKNSTSDYPASDVKITFFAYPNAQAAARDVSLIEEYGAWLLSSKSTKMHLNTFWLHNNGIFLVETRSKEFANDCMKVAEHFRNALLKVRE